MNAIIETGGKQYMVSKGEKIRVEKLSGKEGDIIKFDTVLFTEDGKTFDIGKPYLTGKTVEAKILKQGRGKKIRVFKYKAKSRYRKRQGHRQHYTEIEMTKI